MTLGIMQPYFAPYLGYFDLIRRSDEWVVFDVVQYIRHGWINRNRILHPTEGWQYVVVPLRKHHQTTVIAEIQPAEGRVWRDRILGQLQHYRRRAPHFDFVEEMMREVLGHSHASLVHLNVDLLQAVCDRLGLRFAPRILSEMKLGLPSVHEPGQWALEIASALKADAYINPPGGAELFDRRAFDARGITLIIQNKLCFSYETPGYVPTADLSIIDVMMWNTPEQIRACLTASNRG